MNSSLRAAMQRRYDARILEALVGRLVGKRVLEIGCGRGIGIEILVDRFGAEEVHGIDLDAQLLVSARKRLMKRKYPIRLAVADGTRLSLEDAVVDIVVDFGALHHMPDWREAVREVRRVLRADGWFLFMDVTRQALERWVVRRFMRHPADDRFDAPQLEAELRRHGIILEDRIVTKWFGDLVYGAGRVAAEEGLTVGRAPAIR